MEKIELAADLLENFNCGTSNLKKHFHEKTKKEKKAAETKREDNETRDTKHKADTLPQRTEHRAQQVC